MNIWEDVALIVLPIVNKNMLHIIVLHVITCNNVTCNRRIIYLTLITFCRCDHK